MLAFYIIKVFNGDKGSRTPGLYIANVSLYQLSYIPEVKKV